VSVHPGCRVGDGSRVLDHTHLASATTIGVDCFLSVHVATASDNALGRLPYDPERIQGPVLGDRVAVGASATILPGVHIGDDVTVAAGSVVTKDVAAGCTVLGLPARSRTAETG
jgi:acetyltransferase-like isoleucine patch superfamily enzyme